MLEYILMAMVVIGIVLFAVRPYMNKLQTSLSKSFNTGIFSDDGSGNSFYYFSVK